MLDLSSGQGDESQASQYKSSTAAKLIKPVEVPDWNKVLPSEHESVFGKAKPVNSKNFYSSVFMNGAAQHSTPLISRKSNELLTKVYSFDKEVLLFQRKFVEEGNAMFPVDLDKDNFTRTGVHTTFDRLKCVSGYFMNPMSYTPTDNVKYRQELGLRIGMTPREKAIATEVWRLVWSEAKVKPVNVAKLSTGGMRRFTHDVQWKLSFARWLFEEENFERMLNAVASEDWQVLANEFETVYAMYIQKRGQVDTPGKQRQVMDLLYAMSGGEKGSIFNADKSVVMPDGTKYDDFSALRARVVQAGPWTVNCFLQIVSTCSMHALFDKYPKVFHVNTPEEIVDVVEGKYIFCSDVTEYDRSMDIADIRLAHETMAEVWDERIVKASWRLFTSPYYSKPLSLNTDGKVSSHGDWVGNPMDWSEELHAGNRSGHALTSIMAKVNKVIESLIVIDKMYPVLGKCDSYLRGEQNIGLVNNGDDEIVTFKTAADKARFLKYRLDLNVGRYVVTAEVGQGYSGQLLVKTGETSYLPTARIHTTFEKIWVPERGIGGLHRPYWTVGFIDRVENVTKTELGRRAWDLHMKCYRDMLQPKYGDLMSIVMEAHAKIDIDMDRLDAKSRAVLDDSSKLQHKYTAEEIDPEVVLKVSSKIPIEAVESIINRYYKGVTK